MALMKLEELLLMFLILTTLYGTTTSTYFTVGDSAGWSIPGTVDYHSWSSSRRFVVGDTISGNDSFTIGKPGHYFFVCGISGHCEAGQKLDVRVLKETPPAPPAEMVFENRVPMEAEAPFGLMAQAPEAGSSARTFAYSRLQMVLLLLFGFCFCCFIS